MTIVSFTGSRRGVTVAQCREIWLALRRIDPAECHHGASPIKTCADWAFDGIAAAQHRVTITHPPADRSSRAMMKRNQALVDAADVLIACPDGPRRRRSGTWATVRRAEDRGVPVTIIWPDGTIE